MPKRLPIDMEYVVDVLLHLLRTPSPSGRTDEIMRFLGEEIEKIGLPFELTRRGSLVAQLHGEEYKAAKAIVVHADTIGCMVKRLKDNGRLEVVPVGTFSARFAEGARVRIFTDDKNRQYTGTVLPLKASGHAFGDEIDIQKVAWEQVEVRVDPLQPDFNLAALNTNLRMPLHKWSFRVTHRFNRPLGQGDFGDLAEEYSDGVLHVTTRQDFQLHFVHIDDTPSLMRRLAAAGITTREACGNSVRNITACPYAGVAEGDVLPKERGEAVERLGDGAVRAADLERAGEQVGERVAARAVEAVLVLLRVAGPHRARG